MRHLGFLASLTMMLLAALPIKAQTENEAFYIYQNDGHFDGFFYDEIVKMNFSFLDTLGIEHDEIVSQEIVTPDSTYRIMLSAIDSIGFVQPEVKFNPKLRKLSLYKTDKKDEFIDEQSIWYYYNKNVATLTFDPSNLPAELQPQIDDVFLFPDAEDGFALKVVSFKQNGIYLVACCEPIDDITEIFQQFITVEEYGYDDGGNMVKRRIAGQPDLTIGKFPQKSQKAEGGWEGDIFNFSISGHVPLYATDKLNITIDPSIEGKLHLKTVWNLSWFGDKYIGITSKLKFGVGLGFSVDGKIKDFFPSGIGKLGSIPVPATCPILIIDCGPDVFLRGEAHVNFKMSTPKLNGAMWSKLELKNWIPSIDMGFGNSDDGSKFESVDKNSAGITMSLNGFIQGGMLFPLKFKSLPLLRKICDVEVGGQWFVGPKVSADFTLDLTKMREHSLDSYELLKGVTLGLHLMDADFEVKAKAETLAGVSDVTLADGSISLFPPYDVKLVPEFGDCEEYEEDRLINGEVLRCRIFAFEPKGNVITPMQIGTYSFAPHIWIDSYNWKETLYYNIPGVLGQEYPKRLWAEFVLPYHPHNTKPTISGKIKVQPAVNFFQRFYPAGSAYESWHGAYFRKTSGDTLILNHDWSPRVPITLYSNCDSVIAGSTMKHGKTLEGLLTVTGSEGIFDVSFDQAKALETLDPNYSLVDTLIYEIGSCAGYATINDELFETRKDFHIWVMPNNTVDPIKIALGWSFYTRWTGSHGIYWNPSLEPLNYEITRTDDGKGWHIKAFYHNEEESDIRHVDIEFDYVPKEDGALRHYLPGYCKRNGHFSASRQYRNSKGEIEMFADINCDHFDEMENPIGEVTGQYKAWRDDSYHDVHNMFYLKDDISVIFPNP